MIRALLLCGVLSVGSAWGQTTLVPEATDQEKKDCYDRGGNFLGPHMCGYQTRMPAPAFQAQMDRIEAMLRAICAIQVNDWGQPVCPKETKP